jgi:Short C-terminal domain
MSGFLLVWAAFIGATCWVSSRKGFVLWPMVVLGFVAPAISLIIALAMTPNPGSLWDLKRRAEHADARLRIQGVHPDSQRVASNLQPAPIAEELQKLARLRDEGIVTEAEFAQRKRRLIDS